MMQLLNKTQQCIAAGNIHLRLNALPCTALQNGFWLAWHISSAELMQLKVGIQYRCLRTHHGVGFTSAVGMLHNMRPTNVLLRY